MNLFRANTLTLLLVGVSGPYGFPSGTAILIPVCTIHMNPEYYENPENFDPEHFNLDSVSKRPKLAFLPFSVGARNCIGT